MEKEIEWGWDEESDLKPEAQYWNQWNGHSPELEFCEFAASFINLVKPMVVAETGTGQGYVTRRAVPMMPEGGRYVCFETSVEFVERMKADELFRQGVELQVGQLHHTIAQQADLTIIDSAGGLTRINEIDMWWRASKPGAFVLIHDVSWNHPPVTTHYRHAERVKILGIPGVYMTNPRGSFIGQKHVT